MSKPMPMLEADTSHNRAFDAARKMGAPFRWLARQWRAFVADPDHRLDIGVW